MVWLLLAAPGLLLLLIYISQLCLGGRLLQLPRPRYPCVSFSFIIHHHHQSSSHFRSSSHASPSKLQHSHAFLPSNHLHRHPVAGRFLSAVSPRDLISKKGLSGTTPHHQSLLPPTNQTKPNQTMAIIIKPINPAPSDASPTPPSVQPAGKRLKVNENTDKAEADSRAGALADFSAVFTKPVFTFIVGREAKEYQVHGGLVGKHSSVLDTMMNNGAMKESLTNICTLVDVEPEVFDLFVQWVYRGWYWTGEPVDLTYDVKAYEDIIDALTDNHTPYHCISCGLRCPSRAMRGNFPYCNGDPFSAQRCEGKRKGERLRCPMCSKKYDVGRLDKATAHDFCSDCCHKHNISPLIPQPILHSHWRRFLTPLFHTYNAAVGDLEGYADHVLPKDPPSDDLLAHIKLYVFADRYQIKPLLDLCLFKLHRDMQYHRLNAIKVTDLVVYIFEYTTTMQVEYRNQMEDLVASFCACHSDRLIENEYFASTALIEYDFTRKLIKCLAR